MQNKKKSPFNFNPFKKKDDIQTQAASKKLSAITELLEEKFTNNISVDYKSDFKKNSKSEIKISASVPDKTILTPLRLLQDETEVLQQKVQAKQVELEHLEKAVNDESERVISLNEKLLEHKKAYHFYLGESKRFADLISKMEGQNYKSQNDIELLVKQAHTKKLEMQQAHNILRNIECEYKMNSSLLQNLATKVNKFDPELKKLNEFFIVKKKEAEDIEKKNESLSTSIRNFQKQKIQLVEESRQLDYTISQLNIQNNELDHKKIKLENDVIQLEREHAQKVIERNDADILHNDLEKQQDELEEYLRSKTVEISKLTNEKDHTQSNINQRKNNIIFLQEDITDLDAIIEKEKLNLSRVTIKHKALTSKLETTSQLLLKKQDEFQHINEKKSEMDKSNILIQSKIKHQKVQNNVLTQRLEFVHTDIDQRSTHITNLNRELDANSKILGALTKDLKEQEIKLEHLLKTESNMLIDVNELREKLKDTKRKDKSIIFTNDAKEKSLSRLKNKKLAMQNELNAISTDFIEKQNQNYKLLTTIRETKTERALLSVALQETKEKQRRAIHQSDTLYSRLNYLKKKQAQLVAQTNRKQTEVQSLECSILALNSKEQELEKRIETQNIKNQLLEKEIIELRDEFKTIKNISTQKSESLAILIRKNKHVQERNIKLKNLITENNLKISAINQKNEFFETKLNNWNLTLNKLKKEEEVQKELLENKKLEQTTLSEKFDSLMHHIEQTKLSNKILNDDLYAISETIMNKNKIINENEGLLEKLKMQSRSLQESVKVRKVKLDDLTRKTTAYKDEINMQYDLIKLLRNKIIDLEDKLEIGHEEVQNCHSKFEEGNILLANIEQYEQKLYQRDANTTQV